MNASNTILMIAGAHGEGLSLPEHHGPQHGRTLFRSVTQVPVIVHGKGALAGHHVTGLATTVDLMPTLVSLVGAPALPDGSELDGHDLSPQVRGESSTTARTEVFVDTRYFTADHAAVYTGDRVCQKDFGTSNGDRIETGCYSRTDDPDGHDVQEAPDDPLMKRLGDWRTAQQEAFTAWPHKVMLD